MEACGGYSAVLPDLIRGAKNSSYIHLPICVWIIWFKPVSNHTLALVCATVLEYNKVHRNWEMQIELYADWELLHLIRLSSASSTPACSLVLGTGRSPFWFPICFFIQFLNISSNLAGRSSTRFDWILSAATSRPLALSVFNWIRCCSLKLGWRGQHRVYYLGLLIWFCSLPIRSLWLFKIKEGMRSMLWIYLLF
jgi:hypothetical protein